MEFHGFAALPEQIWQLSGKDVDLEIVRRARHGRSTTGAVNASHHDLFSNRMLDNRYDIAYGNPAASLVLQPLTTATKGLQEKPCSLVVSLRKDCGDLDMTVVIFRRL
jgi:hypothetical protein